MLLVWVPVQPNFRKTWRSGGEKKRNRNVQSVTSPVLNIINHSCAATTNRGGLSFAKCRAVSLRGLMPWVKLSVNTDLLKQPHQPCCSGSFARPLTTQHYLESRNNPSPGPASQALCNLPKEYRCSLATSSEGARVGAERQLGQPRACSWRHEGCNRESTGRCKSVVRSSDGPSAQGLLLENCLYCHKR